LCRRLVNIYVDLNELLREALGGKILLNVNIIDKKVVRMLNVDMLNISWSRMINLELARTSETN
jgi:hypothetical protein